MLEILTNKRLAGDFRLHRARCNAFTAIAQRFDDKNLFPYYIKALKEGSTEVRNIIVKLIGTVNNLQYHRHLTDLLRQNDPDVRKSASLAILAVGGKSTLEQLEDMVGEKSFPGRLEAMDAAVKMAGYHAFDLLQTVIKTGNPTEKTRAIQYLGNTEYIKKELGVAANIISSAFTDQNEMVLMQSIRSYCEICTEDDYFTQVAQFLYASRVRIAKTAVEGLKRFPSPRTMAALDSKLHSGPNMIRLAVLDVLEAIGDEIILNTMVMALEHKQVNVRNRAAEILTTLSKAGKIEVGPTIIWLLRSKDVNVRRMAVEIAGSIKDRAKNLWPKLLACLRDEDWWVRERVIDALVQIAGAEITPFIVEYLNPEETANVRRFAVDVLIRLKDPKVLGPLVRVAQSDEDWWVREKAIEGLGVLNDPRCLPYIIDILKRDNDMRLVCIDTLIKLEAKEHARDIAPLLQDPDPDIKIAVLDCLDKFNDPSFKDQVKLLVNVEHKLVSKAARELLKKWNISFGQSDKIEISLSNLDKILIAMKRSEADDLIMMSGRQAYIKKLGKTIPLFSNGQVFQDEHIRAIIMPHLQMQQIKMLENLEDIDFSYEVRSEGQRFRANVFRTRGGIGMVFRIIKDVILELEKLGLPPVAKGFGDLKNGLVLVGGPTGSGKSTTLAAIIDYINRSSSRHIISLEDPIEVVHDSQKGLVNQREIGSHTPSFHSALRATLREDPDVLLVGELRDLDTIQFAVTAAETGHLVFGTVHTVSADTSVDRLINAYPAESQGQVRSMLSESLRAVLCQYLLKRKESTSRVLATEVMLNTDAVSNLIRKGKTYQIPSIIATSKELGMTAMDTSLMALYKNGIIDFDQAYMKARSKTEFEELLEKENEKETSQPAAQNPRSKNKASLQASAKNARKPTTGVKQTVPRRG